MTRPIIGLLANVDDEQTTSVQRTYVQAIELSGGTPLLLPYTEDAQTMQEYLDLCHGFLFTGGADFEPATYGAQRHPKCGRAMVYRDKLEFTMVETILASGKPIMGICRGMQLLNVACGGDLYQDLPALRPSPISHRQREPKDTPSHPILVLENTPLHRLTQTTRMQGNSFHHQAVRRLGRELEMMAVAEDAVIEAFYHTSHRYLRGYQWHPERLCQTDLHNKQLFDDFVDACR